MLARPPASLFGARGGSLRSLLSRSVTRFPRLSSATDQRTDGRGRRTVSISPESKSKAKQARDEMMWMIMIGACLSEWRLGPGGRGGRRRHLSGRKEGQCQTCGQTDGRSRSVSSRSISAIGSVDKPCPHLAPVDAGDTTGGRSPSHSAILNPISRTNI